MIILYKLVFDISLYIVLTGFYVGMARGTIFARPMAILLIPLAVWIVYAGATKRLRTNYEYFYDEYHFGLRLLPLILPGFIATQRAITAFAGIVPFLVLMLGSGSCLLRMLRERSGSGLRQAGYLLFFLLLSGLLTIGRFLQHTAALISWLWMHVIGPIVYVIMMAVAYVFYFLAVILSWLFSFLQNGDVEMPKMEMQEYLPSELIGEMEESAGSENPFLRYLLITIAAVIILFILIQILKKLFGGGLLPALTDDSRDEIEMLSAAEKPVRRSFFRPAASDDAVRYYYAKFLREYKRRGLDRTPGSTSAEIAGRSTQAFPDSDPAVLRDLYVRARYADMPASKDDADAAQRAWKALKSSRRE